MWYNGARTKQHNALSRMGSGNERRGPTWQANPIYPTLPRMQRYQKAPTELQLDERCLQYREQHSP